MKGKAPMSATVKKSCCYCKLPIRSRPRTDGRGTFAHKRCYETECERLIAAGQMEAGPVATP
jgi:hypothetical protein